MSFLIADRVKETTTSTGTGSLTLAGAMIGFQSFAAGIGNGNQTFYTITDGIDWEVGSGTYFSSGTVLTRDAVIASSNSGNKVDWGVGEKQVFVTYPAAQAVYDFPPNVVVPTPVTATSALGSVSAFGNHLVEYLVLAGGGGGAAYAAGGGAGGYVESTVYITPFVSYSVTIGAGGTKGGDNNLPTDPNLPGTNGSNSSVFSVTAIGGGRGGLNSSVNPLDGADGGSGGGGGRATRPGGAGLQPTATPGIGFGNAGQTFTGNNSQGGGGGGAGGTATGARNEIGGVGKTSSITGTSTYYGGGGGGSGYPGDTAGAGGLGGGGAGGAISSTVLNPGQDGQSNTGGGGGGGNLRSTPSNQAAYGGNGGSGVVILKYPDTLAISNPGGGLTFTTSTAVAGYKITTFTAGTGNVQWS